MEDEPAIIVENVSKSFKLPHEKTSSVKGAFLNVFKGKRTYERQQVLKDISFEIKKGEFFGIVGRNGSGKSTLLKLLAEIYTPDSGEIHVRGSLTPFIELGVGFNPELTGRENVFLNGALLGFNRKQMEKMYDEIVEFAEIEKFMDQKLKNYSSGMQVRLAFSIAIQAKSDILLLDEVLAVGDAIFQQKCFSYFKELKRRKQTVIFVSHDSNALQEYCDRGILIEQGKIVDEGEIAVVVKNYIDLLNKEEEKQDLTKNKTNEIGKKNRWGTGDVEIVKATTFMPGTNEPQTVFTDQDAEVKIKVTYKAKKNCPKPIYGIIISDAAGQQIFASNTYWSDVKTTDLRKDDKIDVEWSVPNIFSTGDFSISPAAADTTGYTSYDWRENYIKFKIRKKQKSSSLTNVKHSINIGKNYAK